MDAVAFMGGGRNEDISVYIGANGETQKLASPEIDRILSDYTEEQLSTAYLENQLIDSQNYLYVHLPDRTLVYNATASQALSVPVWFVLTSSISGYEQYRARYFVKCYNKWTCADTNGNKVGYLTDTISSHYGDDVRWEFGTSIIYNEGKGAIISELELVALTGRVQFGLSPTMQTQYSLDGVTWSQLKSINAGNRGNRSKRLTWFQQGMMQNWRVQRFKGDSQSFLSFARLEAQLEPLAW
jgi:hypothetical protein